MLKSEAVEAALRTNGAYAKKEPKAGTNGLPTTPPEERRMLGNYQTNLCGLDLSGIDFRWVNGHKARMMGSTLARANFQFANLSEAHLEGIQAPHADFRGARLNLASFLPIEAGYKNVLHLSDRHLSPELPVGQRANLRGADFRGANMFRTFFPGRIYAAPIFPVRT